MKLLGELLAGLVRIDSVNPDLIDGAAGEGEIARFVAGWLEEAGLDVEVEEVAPGRFNAVGIARGSGGGRTLLLNAHMDTVGVGSMERPFEPVVENGRMHGRGSYDMKAGLAAIMLAGADAVRAGLRGDVIVTAVCDEEVASIGTARVAERYRADAAIVSEPTELRLVLAHKGFVGFEIETRGRAAHGSRPDLGVDAIAHMGHVLVGIESLDARLRAAPTHPVLGSGSLHASVIEGGQEYSSYPERCLLKGERRTIPGETRRAGRGRAARVCWGRSTATCASRSRGSRSRRRPTRRSSSSSPGTPPPRRVVGAPYWTDSALLSSAGIPTVVFGPAGEGAHAVEEWVDLASAERCVEIYAAVARELCA